MTITPKLLMIAGLVAAIPLTVNVVLSTQVLKQQAAMTTAFTSSAQPVATSGCYYEPAICPMCPVGKQCPPCSPAHLVCPSGTPTCTPMPPQCQPGSPLGANCPKPPPDGWCPSTPPTLQPRNTLTLSCSDCQAQIRNSSLCFSKSQKQSFCRNNALGLPIPGDSVCVRCAVPSVTVTPKPSVTCIPRPACLDAKPACAGVPYPQGGWCPSSPSPTPRCLECGMVTPTPTPPGS